MTNHPALRTATFLAAAGLAAIALPAAAQTSVDNGAPSAATSDNGGTATANRARENRVCVRLELTASRVARRVCKTQAEWDAQGGIPTQE